VFLVYPIHTNRGIGGIAPPIHHLGKKQIEVSGQIHASDALPRYLLGTRLGGSHRKSGQLRKRSCQDSNLAVFQSLVSHYTN
jgi:hypothetical protein